MSTGNEFASITAKKLLGFVDFNAYLLRYLQSSSQEATKRLFIQGAFEERMPLSSPGADQLRVDLKPTLLDGLVHDGAGHLLDLEQVVRTATFENVMGQTYEVGARYIEYPREIRINPRTGKPEYDRFVEGIGVDAEPDDVFVGVGTITFGIDPLFEDGVARGDHTGRLVRVFRTVPGDIATTEAVAIEECTVYYDGANKIDTVGNLGQTTPETSSSFYRVQLIGLTVLRDTATNRPSELPDEVFFIGTVDGNGGTPSAFDITGQKVIQSQAADQITVEALANWADGTTNPDDDLQAVLEKIVTDLTSTSGDRGAAKLTAPALADWADATTNPADILSDTLKKIVTDLTSTTGDRGAGKLTAAARANWADLTTNPVATLAAALAKIVTDLTSTAGSRGAGKLTAPVLSGVAYAVPASRLDNSLFSILSAVNVEHTYRVLDALLDFQLVDTAVSENLRDVAIANGTIVMVGDNATILTSVDGGISWAAGTPDAGFSGTFFGITNRGGNTWIAVGESGEVQTSTDGLTWVRRHTTGNDLHAVANGPQLVAVGDGVCLISVDGGTSWSGGGALPGGGGTNYDAVIYNDPAGLFVATGKTGNAATSLAYSATGAAWTAVNVGIDDVYSLIDGRDRGIVVMGTGGSAFSTDGISYTTDGFGDGYTALFTGNEFIALQVAGSTAQVSYDGTNWGDIITTCFAIPQSTQLRVLEDVFVLGVGPGASNARVAFAPALNAGGVRGYYRSRRWTAPT